MQIELTGYWTREQAQQWRDAGIQQVVYHRSRDAQAAGVAWGEADITAIKRLSDMGFKVTVTGGWRWKICRCSKVFRFMCLSLVAASVMPLLRLKLHVSSNVPSPNCGAKERICCPNKSRLASMKKRSPPGKCWLERLQLAKTLGFDFVEMSVDETDERLSRLDWSREQRLALVNAIVETGVRVPSMCLSAHRRFPLGSEDDAVRAQGLEIMRKAIQFAQMSVFA